ncbi:MAG TPA: Hsp70 family protein, partial [Pyrinomonadaceae bacterium]|nr:Hsp70 family protein [Pyrinomonadaceae bacterium]
DLGTGREQKITITASSGLSKDEIDRMMKDADAHSAEDAKRREAIEAKNRLDGLVYQVEKTFNENKEKLDSGSSTEIEEALNESRTALNSNDADQMNNAFNRLQTASHKLAEVLYNQQGASGGAETTGGEQASSAGAGATGSTGGSGGADDVIDAEYVDVDNDKK